MSTINPKGRTLAQLFALVALFLGLPLMAQGVSAKDYPPPPRDGSIILVFRVDLVPAIEEGFWSKYFDPNYLKKAQHTVEFDYLPEVIVMGNPTFKVPAFGRLGMVKIPRYKDGSMTIKDMRIHIYGNASFFIDLNIHQDIVYPEGANYIYLGDFTVNRKGVFSTVTGIERKDQFDVAKKLVADVYGADAKLIRAKLADPTY